MSTESSDWGHDGPAVGALFHDFAVLAQLALSQTDLGSPPLRFVEHGPVFDDLCNFVAVSVESFLPSEHGKWPRVYLGSNRGTEVGMFPVLALHVRRPCQPTPVDRKGNPFPDPRIIDATTRMLLNDARALTEVWAPSVEHAVDACCGGAGGVSWENLTPHREADCGGWVWRFRVELDGCVTGYVPLDDRPNPDNDDDDDSGDGGDGGDDDDDSGDGGGVDGGGGG